MSIVRPEQLESIQVYPDRFNHHYRSHTSQCDDAERCLICGCELKPEETDRCEECWKEIGL